MLPTEILIEHEKGTIYMHHKRKRHPLYKPFPLPAILLSLTLTACFSFCTAVFAGEPKHAGSSTDTLQNEISAASAKFPPAVTDTEPGIVQVVLSCVDDNGNTCYLRQGTGFLIGSKDETQYIITDRTTITPDRSELDQIRKWNGLDSSAKLTPQIQFLMAPDIAITASVISQGSDLPYALLTPAAPLSNSEYLKLGSIASVSRKDTAYLYGYNLEMSLLGLTEVSGSTPALRAGTITSVQTDPATVSCDMEGESGCAGAPLLDAQGHVLGMFYYTKDNLEILPADTIRTILETLNISYRSTDPASDYNVADDRIQKELSDLLRECQQDVTKHGSEYSEKTLSNYKAAISNAMTVIASQESTRDNYQESMDALTTAREKLKPANFTIRMVQFLFLGILLLLVFFNIRQLQKSRKLMYTLHPELSSPDTASPNSLPADNLPVSPDSRFPDTISPSLRRMDTGEIIPLGKQPLRLGKSAQQADYCITDNPAISRLHASIIHKENRYYIIDNRSTNHTKVNGSVIPPEYPVPLKNNDLISLADMDFQFHNTK